ncbi:hypothetical protein Adt_18704 [Abeliophyllum distichum]|uniref:Uncharacterized protein n=1 Tax=Abeliophyllum distichum TaxID=126358 RepID=A0ABD1TK41_9LAMI
MVHYLHYDALVVNVEIARNALWRILVDSGVWSTLSSNNKMEVNCPSADPNLIAYLWIHKRMYRPYRQYHPIVILGEASKSAQVFLEFFVIDSRSTYNSILGWPSLKVIIPSTISP